MEPGHRQCTSRIWRPPQRRTIITTTGKNSIEEKILMTSISKQGFGHHGSLKCSSFHVRRPVPLLNSPLRFVLCLVHARCLLPFCRPSKDSGAWTSFRLAEAAGGQTHGSGFALDEVQWLSQLQLSNLRPTQCIFPLH